MEWISTMSQPAGPTSAKARPEKAEVAMPQGPEGGSRSRILEADRLCYPAASSEGRAGRWGGRACEMIKAPVMNRTLAAANTVA